MPSFSGRPRSFAEVELEPGQEEQDRHAELGEHLDGGIGVDEVEQRRPHDDAGGDLDDRRRDRQLREQPQHEWDQHRQRHDRQQVVEAHLDGHRPPSIGRTVTRCFALPSDVDRMIREEPPMPGFAALPDAPRWQGVNHLALVTPDMDATVRFYAGVLGMRLVATTMAGPMRHYFFEMARGNAIAFFEVAGTDTFAKPAGGPSDRTIQFDHLSFDVADEHALRACASACSPRAAR